jgi:hypothetical protein
MSTKGADSRFTKTDKGKFAEPRPEVFAKKENAMRTTRYLLLLILLSPGILSAAIAGWRGCSNDGVEPDPPRPEWLDKARRQMPGPDDDDMPHPRNMMENVKAPPTKI